ncbi:hypothetical protein Ga0100231_001435 [Opitutaceae bacterium TAV4]|nr:hypothetical protein Ga0100231_001435 [Opitutaceae bacterium TAV4]RRK01553.1 hypothetical protein Ga0100230_006745 [Opitutaceae bacterium TAV3]
MNTHITRHSSRRVQSCLLLVSALFCASALSAANVTDWRKDNGATLTDAATNAPVLGTGAAASANATLISASISPVTLANIGDSLTFSGTVTFEGLGGQLQYGFRWGLFNTGGSANANGWLGYWAENGSNTASDGVKPSRLWERAASNTGSWWSSSSGAATQIKGVNPDNSAYFVDGSYSFNIRYELTAANTITISWSLVETSTATKHSVSGSFEDNSPQTLTFNRVGIGNAGFNASKISFANLQANYVAAVPEPSSVAWISGLLALIVTARLCRKRN